MDDIVLSVQNISKQYRLGQLGTGTISHDLNRWWYQIRGKEDPYFKLGDTNDRNIAGGSNYVWALKDISFEVEQGEVLGIIGKNGAGKSTLLKILSQITSPSKGKVDVCGRIASLLEIGTGFHPDLSGRENIFLNGAILGMSKPEIKKKLDEIIDFSGVAKYVDTPVKRYSSGMMVRLGFAVAAHLEPEILIIDEVLAVGDAEFQKKCLGKLRDVSGQGRTVLFVSHNIAAIQSLCSKAMLLKNGELEEIGNTNDVVKKYVSAINLKSLSTFEFAGTNETAYATRLTLSDLNGNGLNEIPIGSPWKVVIDFTVVSETKDLIVGLGLLNNFDSPVRTSWNKAGNLSPGNYKAVFIEDTIYLASGGYKLLVGISIGKHSVQYIDDHINFSVSDVVEDMDKAVLENTNGIIINQMKMSIERS